MQDDPRHAIQLEFASGVGRDFCGAFAAIDNRRYSAWPIDGPSHRGLLWVLGLLWSFLFSALRKSAFNWHSPISALIFVLLLPAATPVWQLVISLSFGLVFGDLIFGSRGTGLSQRGGRRLGLPVVLISRHAPRHSAAADCNRRCAQRFDPACSRIDFLAGHCRVRYLPRRAGPRLACLRELARPAKRDRLTRPRLPYRRPRCWRKHASGAVALWRARCRVSPSFRPNRSWNWVFILSGLWRTSCQYLRTLARPNCDL